MLAAQSKTAMSAINNATVPINPEALGRGMEFDVGLAVMLSVVGLGRKIRVGKVPLCQQFKSYIRRNHY
jgi:hypothetical protein